MNWLRFIARRSAVAVTATGLLLVLILGVIDYVTGPEISFSIFYLIPVAAASWVVGVAAGIAMSVLAAISFLMAILLEQREYAHPSIPYWNALVRLGFFFIVAFSLSSLRTARNRREELGQFIVHDLRSPLANVMTGLSILQEDYDKKLDEQQKRFVEMCMVSCTRMLTMINSMLDLTRLENDRMPLHRKNVPAIDLSTAALNQVQLWSRQKNVRLDESVPNDISVYADAEVTVRVIVNLLSNAVKHAPDGSVVTITVERQDTSHVAFTVRDEGAGVPEEWAEKIFDAYTQVDLGQPGTSAGSGLGLTFSRRAVQAQDGEIWMKSSPNAGTAVTFTLPAGSEPERASAEPEPDV